MSEFKNRVALVTGGTSGIGRAAAVEFGRAGAKVVVTGRRKEEGEKTVRDVKEAGGEALFVQGDVSKEADIRAWVDAAMKTFGRLDFAFNNAGIEFAGPVVEANAADFRRVFDVNVLGVLLSMKHQIPAMIKSGASPSRQAAIVNNASAVGTIGLAGVSIYAASKHAVLGLTKVAALEVAKQGIRINAISPAAIETEMYDRFIGGGGSQSEQVKAFTALHPIGRIGKPIEIARPVLFLCSEAASFMTGHDLKVDGGFTVP